MRLLMESLSSATIFRVWSRWRTGRAASPTRSLGVGPLFGERLKHLGRFVTNHALPVGHGADQSAKNRKPSKCQIRTAIVDANLFVHAQKRILMGIIFVAKFAVCAASDDSKCSFIGHAEMYLDLSLVMRHPAIV